MTDWTSSPSAPQNTAEVEVVMEEMLAEMRLLSQQMQQDRAEIDRIKVETNALKLETEKLKAEGHRLDTETRAVLGRLKAVV